MAVFHLINLLLDQELWLWSKSRFSNNGLCGRGSRRGFLVFAKKSILKLVSPTAVGGQNLSESGE